MNDLGAIIRKYEQDAMEADYRAQVAVARAKAMNDILIAATNFYVAQITAPVEAMAWYLHTKCAEEQK